MHSLLRLLALGSLSAASALQVFAEDEAKPKTSAHVSRMIQEGFRQQYGHPLPPETSRANSDAPPEVVLPTMRIQAGPRLISQDLVAKEPPKPVLGTGVNEYKGRRFTAKLRRLLFIPVAFKLEW